MQSDQLRIRIRDIGYPILGQRLLRARTFLKLSVRDLAEKAQVSKNTITRIEKGQAVHDDTIKLIARALRIKLELLFAPMFSIGHARSVHRLDASKWFDLHTFTGIPTSRQLPMNEDWPQETQPFTLLSSRDDGGRFNPNIMVLRRPTEMRSHRGEEFAMVLSGQIRVVFDDEEVVLRTGESIYFWATENHRYEPEPADQEARILSIVLDPDPTPLALKAFIRTAPTSPIDD